MGKLILCFGVHGDPRKRPACSALQLINDANNGSMANPSGGELGQLGIEDPH